MRFPFKSRSLFSTPFTKKSSECYFMKVLPKVAAEVSAPLSQTEKITMVSDGDGPIGASKVLVHVQIQNNYLVKIHGCHGPTIAGKVRIHFQMQNAY